MMDVGTGVVWYMKEGVDIENWERVPSNTWSGVSDISKAFLRF